MALAERATKEWSEIAGEPLEIQEVGGALYAFGSELACLRLEHKMRIGRANYSLTRLSWFYEFEVRFSPTPT